MTTIERLWDKAKEDREHLAVNNSLLEQSTLICPHCGAVTKNGECTCVYEPLLGEQHVQS